MNAKDAAGSISAATLMTVIDKTAPVAPKITSIVVKNRNEVTISGKGEPGATLTVKVGTRNVTVKVASNGLFSAKVSSVAKGANSIMMHPTDASGNKGTASKSSIVIK